MEFEWDEAKRQRNLQRHGIDFVDVVEAFEKCDAVRIEDQRRDYGEERLMLMCELQRQFLHITYTMRGASVRLISARHGNRRERRRYEQAQKDES